MAVPSTSGVRRRHPVDGPLGGAQHPAAAPLLPRRRPRVGLVLPAVIAAQWGDPWGGLLVAGFLRAAVLLQATFCVNSLAHLVGTRRYDAGSSARDSVLTALITFGEGYHSPSPIPLRLPQQSSLVALRPEQMAELNARPHRNGQRVANRLGRHHRQGRHVGARRGLTGPVACVVDRHASAGAMAKPSDEVGPVPICRRCTRSRRRPAPPPRGTGRLDNRLEASAAPPSGSSPSDDGPLFVVGRRASFDHWAPRTSRRRRR